METNVTRIGMNKVGTAYLLWLGCLLQVHGLHRLYNGKILTGLLWMFSFGLFGFGQIIDLLLIPNMVDQHNSKLRARQGLLPEGALPNQAVIQRVVATHPTPLPPTSNPLLVQLLRAAETRGGKLSVTQGVMETGASFAHVEATLIQMVKAGYADITNDPETGVVTYEFKEL
ncbi:NINE protein [Stenomitos frigidus]|nr:NINE protein [Stenomitos frigidus]